ncbi:hypothetical protein BD413DRAFT_680442 [Trametes elegans]|nr:hypothetical protein BD413DRAFT_680442 [Trametes elegans]
MPAFLSDNYYRDPLATVIPMEGGSTVHIYDPDFYPEDLLSEHGSPFIAQYMGSVAIVPPATGFAPSLPPREVDMEQLVSAPAYSEEVQWDYWLDDVDAKMFDACAVPEEPKWNYWLEDMDAQMADAYAVPVPGAQLKAQGFDYDFEAGYLTEDETDEEDNEDENKWMEMPSNDGLSVGADGEDQVAW